MRNLCILAVYIFLTAPNGALAQFPGFPAPVAKYHPETGGITFTDLQFMYAISEFDSAYLWIEIDSALTNPANARPLNIPAQSVDFQSYDTGMSWRVMPPLTALIPEPLFAGRIIEPGTNPASFSLLYGRGLSRFPQPGVIEIIPEPSTASLLIAGIVPALVRKCW